MYLSRLSEILSIMADTERKDLQEQELAKSAVLISSSSLSLCTIPVKGVYFVYYLHIFH